MVYWCISAGKVIDFPIAETGASKEPLVPDSDTTPPHYGWVLSGVRI